MGLKRDVPAQRVRQKERKLRPAERGWRRRA
jgi:hypothetical protein